MSSSSVRIASSAALTRCCPRSPWYQASTTTIGRPTARTEHRELLDECGQREGVADEAEDLQQHPRAGRVRESPLDHLAAPQFGPGAIGFTLCRRVGQSAAPMARSVAAYPRVRAGNRSTVT